MKNETLPCKSGEDAGLPDDVRALVIAAREFWDDENNGTVTSHALDKALEPFSSRVPYNDEPTPSEQFAKSSPEVEIDRRSWTNNDYHAAGIPVPQATWSIPVVAPDAAGSGGEARLKLTMPNGDVLTPCYPGDVNWAKSWTSRDTQGRVATQEQDFEVVESYGLTALFAAYRDALTPDPLADDATQTREAEGEQFAKIAECAFDDRPRSRVGHPSQMDWDDGYRDGTRAAASAIRAALNGRGGA